LDGKGVDYGLWMDGMEPWFSGASNSISVRFGRGTRCVCATAGEA